MNELRYYGLYPLDATKGHKISRSTTMITSNPVVATDPIREFAYQHELNHEQLALLLGKEPIVVKRYLFRPSANDYRSPPRSVYQQIKTLKMLSSEQIRSLISEASVY